MELNNATINKNKQFFKIKLETNTTIKKLAFLTVYNWQSVNIIDDLVFSAVLDMWNNIRYINNNDKSFAFYYQLIKAIQISIIYKMT